MVFRFTDIGGTVDHHCLHCLNFFFLFYITGEVETTSTDVITTSNAITSGKSIYDHFEYHNNNVTFILLRKT